MPATRAAKRRSNSVGRWRARFANRPRASATAGGIAVLEKAVLTSLLRQMYRIRLFEERLKRHYDYQAYVTESPSSRDDGFIVSDGYDFASKGLIGGAVHLSIGQEAVSVGVCAHLEPTDAAFSSHRSHGHAMAKGIPLPPGDGGADGPRGRLLWLRRLDAPIRPGSWLPGGNGIVGGQPPLALGPAFAAKYQGTRGVSVAFFGDGAANQGTLLESLNLAALWKLPVLRARTTSTPTPRRRHLRCRCRTWHPRPRPGHPGEVVDGQDVLAVYDAAEGRWRARDGQGPTLLEMKTYRFEGHCGVAGEHQNPESARSGGSAADPPPGTAPGGRGSWRPPNSRRCARSAGRGGRRRGVCHRQPPARSRRLAAFVD